MRLHNFLVDYRLNSINEIRDQLQEDFMDYIQNMHEDDIIPGVIVNDNTRPSGNITFEERVRRINGIQLRNQLK